MNDETIRYITTCATVLFALFLIYASMRVYYLHDQPNIYMVTVESDKNINNSGYTGIFDDEDDNVDDNAYDFKFDPVTTEKLPK